jgi:hypothetical protein
MPVRQWIAKDVMTISNFFSSEECDDWIGLSESLGYEEAAVTTETGMVMMKSLRNNDRVMLDDAERAEDLWDRVQSYVPALFKDAWRPIGVNERLRLYRYDPGQQFDWHTDGYFERDNGDRSCFTFMIYLNEGFDGGATSFNIGSTSPKRFQVTPRKGMALLFHHPIPHKGEPVRRGRKYVLRTDVMFRLADAAQSGPS